MKACAILVLPAAVSLGLLSRVTSAHDPSKDGNSRPYLFSHITNNQLQAPDREESFERGQKPRTRSLSNCTADQILPSVNEDVQDRWVPHPLTDTRTRPYDCTCPYLKASYFCKDGLGGYPSWVPKAVADGDCVSVDRDVLAENPFPAGTTLLFYGNSHLRQVFEGIMCKHQEQVVGREVMFTDNDRDIRTVASLSPEDQCKGCMTGWDHIMKSYGCVPPTDVYRAMRCCDDRAVYHLRDDVTVHFWFAHREGNKSIDHAFNEFNTSVADYDFVVANAGNSPRMSTPNVVRAAQSFHDASVSFLWLTTFEGAGDIRHFASEEREIFTAAGAKYVPVHYMMESMTKYTRGVAEGSGNNHFCLPGPPDELGVLILQLIWSLHLERQVS